MLSGYINAYYNIYKTIIMYVLHLPVRGHNAFTAIPSDLNSCDIPKTARVTPYLETA